MPQSPPLPQPPRRAPAFADSVRRRVRPRLAPVLGHGWTVGDGRPSVAEQVLRPGRASVVHDHWHASGQTALRLAVSFDLGGRYRPGHVRTQWRTVGAPVLRDARRPGPRISSGLMEYPARMQLLSARAASTSPVVVSPPASATAGTPVRELRGAAAGGTAQRAMSTVAMTHRSPATTTPAAARGAAPHPSQSSAMRWAGDAAPGVGAVVPLTAADLPSVIDRVVGELDRRVTAARERKGWTA